ncbi:MAG: small, acid-soluble spore protein, alpha/beta type [Candidatus Faecivicinus sp.]
MATKNSNQINVPEARQAMYNMKHEVANELGITLNQGYNGNMTSKDAGHIGGNMVKKMIEEQERQMSGQAQNQPQNRY